MDGVRELITALVERFCRIHFPLEEWSTLWRRLLVGQRIFTTRVEEDLGRYEPGMRVIAPWGQVLRVVRVDRVRDVERHPFKDELSKEQRSRLAEYAEMDVIELEEQK